ncbi:quinoprotein relay system zinc metallohydrolase 2 [Massilia sp. CMS3.1]|uniref:quinoprotein relay system zinc metallohydrolase 2 n=1 Tax=Massilia sp. CMS3.1 TaxID=3373083 RepID=UPI003EE62A1E
MGRLLHVAWLLAAAAAAHVSAAPLQVEQVAPGVYVHIGQHKDFEDGYDGDIANIGFVIGTDAVAVIDTGGSYAVGMALKEALRKITGLPIRYVINTHGHPDHVFGNAAFIDAGPAGAGAPPRFIGHAMLPQAMASRGDAYLRNVKKQLGGAAEKSTLIPPTETVQHRLSLDLGNRQLELTAWPKAHTNNDLTLFDVSSGTLWTGDLLFIERTPSIDGDVKGWFSAMEALKKIKAVTTIPGHGPLTRDKNRALDRQGAYLATLLHDVRTSIRQGTDMTATMATAAASERARWQLFDVVNRRNVNVIYPALEWE